MQRMAVVLAVLLVAGLSACTDRDGSAEEAGERIDDAISDARDRFEAAGEEIEEAADDVRDALRDE